MCAFETEIEGKSGIDRIEIRKEVDIIVETERTGESDSNYNPIRERKVSREEVKEIAEEHGWEYVGEVDVINDYFVKDRVYITY